MRICTIGTANRQTIMINETEYVLCCMPKTKEGQIEIVVRDRSTPSSSIYNVAVTFLVQDSTGYPMPMPGESLNFFGLAQNTTVALIPEFEDDYSDRSKLKLKINQLENSISYFVFIINSDIKEKETF